MSDQTSTNGSTRFTSDNQLKTSDGKVYRGYYHINPDGSIESGEANISGSGVPLYPIDSIARNKNGELVSQYDSNNKLQGYLSIISVKNYKNDIDLSNPADSSVLIQQPAPTITKQPSDVFVKNTSLVYNPGGDILIDINNTIQVLKGKVLTLDFNYTSNDIEANVKFEWRDSFNRLVSTKKELEILTGTINVQQETFTCTVTDTYGSDFTNPITISIIDTDTNPYIKSNILQNGSANEGTANWETNGDNSEEVGKFLINYEEAPIASKDFNGNFNYVSMSKDARGTHFYHKLSTNYNGQYINQWYPRPEHFDAENKLKGSLLAEIKENYFRGGIMNPVLRGKENDHSGTTKTSKQDIDISQIADIVDGKVYGIAGLESIIFGWLGSRADQNDRCWCEYDYLDANDKIIRSSVDKIEGPGWFNKIVTGSFTYNLSSKTDDPGKQYIYGYDSKISYVKSWFSNQHTTLYDGVYNTSSKYTYLGINKDYNAGVVGYEQWDVVAPYRFIFNDGTIVSGSAADVAFANSKKGVGKPGKVAYELRSSPIYKTVIVGRSGKYNKIPAGTRKIRVTKTYTHEGSIMDLIWGGWKLDDKNVTYKSEALMVGLNVRLYPILK